MTRQQWQKVHGLTDEEMERVALIKQMFNASEIFVTDKSERSGLWMN